MNQNAGSTRPQRQIRIVELLLYLPSCKMDQVLSDVWDHLKNSNNTNSIQSYCIHTRDG
jgi:hypothetical protein